jgi:hypothetical protein
MCLKFTKKEPFPMVQERLVYILIIFYESNLPATLSMYLQHQHEAGEADIMFMQVTIFMIV